jgi:hypothetical protein
MLAADARFHSTRLTRALRDARPADHTALLVDAGEPAAFPVARVSAPRAATSSFTTAPVMLPAAGSGPLLAPAAAARTMRRLRVVVRRRLRVDLAGLADGTVTDGGLRVSLETVSPRDPYLVEWTADRPVALVVLHDGCGARVIGTGGQVGRLELPATSCPGAFLAFCHDVDTREAIA